jgi:hypothetical protein
MGRDCIICGKRAGSREHIFPAALGGRRTNKGIYCGKHNNDFSPLAGILAEQLRSLNALLSIRPDHAEAPTTFVVDAPDGGSFVLSGDGIELANPHKLKETVVGTSREIAISFSSQEQVDEWLAAQLSAGNDVRISSRREGTGYFVQPLKFELRLGGPEGLRAVGYLMLTFFAHHFPAEARQQGLSEFKKFTQNLDDQKLVWWVDPDRKDDLQPNPFAFGHTVGLGISASTGEAFARVSLFSALNFEAHLGTVEAVSDRTVTVHIDPQAQHPPQDIIEFKQDSLAFDPPKPNSGTFDLREAIRTGRAQKSLQQLFSKIERWHLDHVVSRMLGELTSLRDLDENDLNGGVRAIMEREGQRLLNLITHAAVRLRTNFEADPATKRFLPYFTELTVPDPTNISKLSAAASDVLEEVKAKFAVEIKRRLFNNDLNAEQLAMLFGGQRGLQLVVEVLRDRLLGRI